MYLLHLLQLRGNSFSHIENLCDLAVLAILPFCLALLATPLLFMALP